MSKQVKYRGRWFPLKAEDGDYVIIESYGLERRVLKDEIIYEEPEEPKDVLKAVIPDKLEETMPPTNDIVTPKLQEEDEFHGKKVKNIRDGRIGTVASIGTLRHTTDSQSVTVYWETDPKNPQEVDKRLLEIVPEESASPNLEQAVQSLPKDNLPIETKPEETLASPLPKINEALPTPQFNTDLLPKETIDPTSTAGCDIVEKFKEEMKKVWENSFSNKPTIKAGTYAVDIEYPDSESPGETLTYRVVFDIYGAGLEEMNIKSVDDLDSPQENTADYDAATLEKLVDDKIATGEVSPVGPEEHAEVQTPQGDSNALDSDYLDENSKPENDAATAIVQKLGAQQEDLPMVKRILEMIQVGGPELVRAVVEDIIKEQSLLNTGTSEVAPVKEEATVAPVAGGTNQGQKNGGVFSARLGQKAIQPKSL